MRPELMLPEAEVHSVIVVEIRTLDSIVEEAALGRVDFVSVDVEGFELEVLKGFSIQRWRPRLVLIEDHVTGLEKHRYMASQGYKLVRRTGVNAWYVPRGPAVPEGTMGRFATVAQIRRGPLLEEVQILPAPSPATPGVALSRIPA